MDLKIQSSSKTNYQMNHTLTTTTSTTKLFKYSKLWKLQHRKIKIFLKVQYSFWWIIWQTISKMIYLKCIKLRALKPINVNLKRSNISVFKYSFHNCNYVRHWYDIAKMFMFKNRALLTNQYLSLNNRHLQKCQIFTRNI